MFAAASASTSRCATGLAPPRGDASPPPTLPSSCPTSRPCCRRLGSRAGFGRGSQDELGSGRPEQIAPRETLALNLRTPSSPSRSSSNRGRKERGQVFLGARQEP